MAVVLNVQNIAYSYTTQQVLIDVTCQLDAGQIGLLIGRNGSGKSTFLRCVAGWLHTLDGKIHVNAISPNTHERDFRRQVVLVPDVPDFYDELTAWEHLQFIAQLHHKSFGDETAEYLLDQFGLIAQRHAFPFTFSRGMRYKLALCMAFLVRPPLLLLDEPFGSLDAPTQESLWQIIKGYAEDDKAVLFSSHSLSQDRNPHVVLHLHDGYIETIQPSDALSLVELLRNNDP